MKQSAQVVYDALLAAGPEGMTSLDLWRAGCGSRAAARVADLQAEGIGVRSELVQVETAQGTARVSRYFLTREPVRAGHPVGALRVCPACKDIHHVGTTCDWGRQAV